MKDARDPAGEVVGGGHRGWLRARPIYWGIMLRGFTPPSRESKEVGAGLGAGISDAGRR